MNSDNRTFYIGKTINIEQRYKQHKATLKPHIVDFSIVPICKSNNDKFGHLEWYFIDWFRYEHELLNRTNFFTRPIAKTMNLIDYCVKYGIKHVEILDFTIFSK